MTRPAPITLPTPTAAPTVQLLDAQPAGLDHHELRAWARSLCHAGSPPFASRSYRYPYALIARHTAPVGIDIERIEPCDPRFAATICTPAHTRPPATVNDPDRYLSSMWSSKEALTKALGHPLDYNPRHLEAPMLWPDHQAGPWHTTQLPVPHHHVAWLCWTTTHTAGTSSPDASGTRVDRDDRDRHAVNATQHHQ